MSNQSAGDSRDKSFQFSGSIGPDGFLDFLRTVADLHLYGVVHLSGEESHELTFVDGRIMVREVGGSSTRVAARVDMSNLLRSLADGEGFVGDYRVEPLIGEPGAHDLRRYEALALRGGNQGSGAPAAGGKPEPRRIPKVAVQEGRRRDDPPQVARPVSHSSTKPLRSAQLRAMLGSLPDQTKSSEVPSAPPVDAKSKPLPTRQRDHAAPEPKSWTPPPILPPHRAAVPAETSTETSTQTPAETSTQTPAETSTQTPAETSTGTPSETPAGTRAGSVPLPVRPNRNEDGDTPSDRYKSGPVPISVTKSKEIAALKAALKTPDRSASKPEKPTGQLGTVGRSETAESPVVPQGSPVASASPKPATSQTADVAADDDQDDDTKVNQTPSRRGALRRLIRTLAS